MKPLFTQQSRYKVRVKVQLLDILQICWGAYASRGLISTAEKEISSGADKTLVKAIGQNSSKVS
ncbi:MAG: hypothetical protein ACSLEM_05920 [Candidatus Malihini olakiniferum]